MVTNGELVIKSGVDTTSFPKSDQAAKPEDKADLDALKARLRETE